MNIINIRLFHLSILLIATMLNNIFNFTFKIIAKSIYDFH